MYKIKHVGDRYSIENNGLTLKTPMGSAVVTDYLALAERLVRHLEKYGEDPSNPQSIVAFHYAMLDFFHQGPRSEHERMIAIGLNPGSDWTLSCPSAEPNATMKWISLFGTCATQTERGLQWLASLSLTQLCAVCVIGRALESVNIPFIACSVCDLKDLSAYAKAICDYYPYVSPKELSEYFDNMYFYFNLGINSKNGAEQPKPKIVSRPEESDEDPEILKYLVNIADAYRYLGSKNPALAEGMAKAAEFCVSKKSFPRAEELLNQALNVLENAEYYDRNVIATVDEIACLVYKSIGKENQLKEYKAKLGLIKKM